MCLGGKVRKSRRVGRGENQSEFLQCIDKIPTNEENLEVTPLKGKRELKGEERKVGLVFGSA